MLAKVNTASVGSATVFQDERGVHVSIQGKNGKAWEAGLFAASKHQELPQAWEAAIHLARQIIDGNKGGAA